MVLSERRRRNLYISRVVLPQIISLRFLPLYLRFSRLCQPSVLFYSRNRSRIEDRSSVSIPEKMSENCGNKSPFLSLSISSPKIFFFHFYTQKKVSPSTVCYFPTHIPRPFLHFTPYSMYTSTWPFKLFIPSFLPSSLKAPKDSAHPVSCPRSHPSLPWPYLPPPLSRRLRCSRPLLSRRRRRL